MNKNDKERLDRIEQKIDIILDKLDNYSNRLTKVETIQSGTIRLGIIIFTGIVGFFFKTIKGF